MVKIHSNIQILVLLLIILIGLEGGSALINLSSYSYTTSYQGAKAQFAGIKYKNEEYSGAGFDTGLHFDPDEPQTGMCNLVGEMTSVFIPSESLSNSPAWVDIEWLRQSSYIKNPKQTYEWNKENFTYTMEEWQLRWYFTISAEWDDVPAWGWITNPELADIEWMEKRYTNTEIWFEFDLNPTWYFEPVRADTAYFAIAKLQVADVSLHALDNAGDEVEPELETSVRPESQGSIMPVYYGLFAEQNPADKEVNDYQGKQLNPDLFTSKVYSYFTLENFGTHHWTEFPLVDKWKGDVVTVAVDVTVFVIGEWAVQDIESLEEYEGYGRTAKLGSAGLSWGDWFQANQTWITLIVIIAIVIIIAILAPSLFTMLGQFINSFTGGKRR